MDCPLYRWHGSGDPDGWTSGFTFLAEGGMLVNDYTGAAANSFRQFA